MEKEDTHCFLKEESGESGERRKWTPTEESKESWTLKKILDTHCGIKGQC